MIPLMMTQGYSAKGWLGLILGTRMWYGFWDADEDDDAAFERRIDVVIREVGDRGKLRIPEATPPEPTPAPAPASSRGPAPAPAPASAPVPQTPQPSALHFTPSVQPSPAPMVMQQEVGRLAPSDSASSVSEMVTFVREQRHHDDKLRQEAKAERQELEAKMEAKVDKLIEDAAERQRREMEEKIEAVEARVAKVERERQLAALPGLQARLESLHASKLLTDDELYTLEDVIADSFEEEGSQGGSGGRVAKLVVLSERVAGDAALARQLRRKFA